MATAKKKAIGEANTEPVEAPSNAEAPPEIQSRQQPPEAPALGLLVPVSRDAVKRIEAVLRYAMASRHPQGAEAGLQTLQGMSTLNMHPAVAAYRAEVMDYLLGKSKEA